MDEAELRDAEKQGIRIESHGHGHIDLARSDAGGVADDLRRSVGRLSEILGRRPRYLAYPYGRQSPDTRLAVEAAGFEDAFLYNDVDKGRFQRERILVDGQEEYVRFWLKTAGGYIARRRSRLGTATASVIRRVVPRPVRQ